MDEAIQRLETRQGDFSFVRELSTLQNARKDKIAEVERLKAFRNEQSKKIGELKRQKLDASEVLSEVAHIGDEIKTLDDELQGIETKIFEILSIIPNLPHQSVPIGKDENDNQVIRVVGKQKNLILK